MGIMRWWICELPLLVKVTEESLILSLESRTRCLLRHILQIVHGRACTPKHLVGMTPEKADGLRPAIQMANARLAEIDMHYASWLLEQ